MKYKQAQYMSRSKRVYLDSQSKKYLNLYKNMRMARASNAVLREDTNDFVADCVAILL